MASNYTQIRDKAIQIAREAIGFDQQQQYEEALQKYKIALEYFVYVLKYETNTSIQNSIKLKFNEYCTRAEQIQKILEEKKGINKQQQEQVQATPNQAQSSQQQPSNQTKMPGPGQANDPKSQEKGDKPANEEEEKLQQALQSAIVTEKPNIKWDDVAGLDLAKESLHEAIIYPSRFPELFVGKRTPWKGILLYGPPGTGKTYLAKACATEADATFFSVSSSDLVSKFMGESERLVKELFSMARNAKPSIVFIDEIDSLASNRSEGEHDATRRIKTEFLVQMQGLGHKDEGVLILGATNVPWELDPAVRRRFSKRIYIPLPDAPARAVMFKINIGKTPNNLTEQDFQTLGENTEGFSGSDISIVTQEALYEPLRKCRNAQAFKQVKIQNKTCYIPCSPSDPQAQEMTMMQVPAGCLQAPDIEMDDFMAILNGKAKATVSQSDLKKYEDWTTEFGQEGS